MMNLLFIAHDTSSFIHRSFFYLEQELANVVNVEVWRKSGHIDTILKQLHKKPDFILIMNDIEKEMSPQIRGLAHIDVPVGLFINDAHRFTKLRKSYIEKHNIPYLLPVVRDYFLKTYPEYEKKMIWMPHFVQTELFKDYELEKDIDLLLIGAVNDYYPIRQKIRKAYEGDADFVYYKHPGYRNFNGEEEELHAIGESYAKVLNRAKITFTCPSKLFYPVLKYYEALACKTLLLAPTFTELEDLGFRPGYHFVAIDEHNFQEKATYYLTNEKERLKIVEQGYQFVRKYHSLQVRTQQLVNRMERILQM
ncbi:glycosyltransferase [Radiobacillus deserti]|uniref:Glycosyltransferase family 1 protein n=1 Tax=Radiobacillus deserti TaxID=2594883 RepID=A0A516KD40_9BACI|nr:glycosyltransferase [Radiobacillus deserti]QDP39290.1 glycosyltransferase family 1 protein [Radiobacillus deserti]